MATTATKKKAPSARQSGAWKGKKPGAAHARGQWTEPKSDADDTGIGFVTVSVKLRPEEKAELKRVCTKLGITPNKALRTMARRSSGFLEVQDRTLEHLATLTRQISGVSTNINQIAKAANRTQSPDYVAFMQDRRELGAHLAELEDIIREIVNVGRRRSDGLRGLEEALLEE